MYEDNEAGRLADITDSEQLFQAGGMSNEQLLEGWKRLAGKLLDRTPNTAKDQEWRDRMATLREAMEAELIRRGVNPRE